MLYENFKKYKIGIEGISETSVNQYEKELNRLYEHFGKTLQDDDFIIELTANDLKSYVEFLSSQNKEATTKNKSIAVVKSFYKYLYNEENIEIDTKIFFVKKAKLKHKEPLWLEKDAINNYIKSISCPRTKAMVRILCSTGLRFSELVNLTLQDFLNGKAVIIGKGNKQREIYFGDKQVQNDVYNYIFGKRKRIIEKTGKDTNILFINNKGNKMIEQNFNRALKMYARNTEGFVRSDEMSPHKLRHSFITNALLDGTPISVVRDAVGHSNITTTNNYAHSTKKSIENLMNNNMATKQELEMFGLL